MLNIHQEWLDRYVFKELESNIHPLMTFAAESSIEAINLIYYEVGWVENI